ncbi:hypothetical protein GIB67_003715 [Kingdonia uniflora]|uniref:mRNA export factor GLE1 n=1 Tax=Kingdonia uniflora TaxID=39325 RepID=A0A7J7M3W6_9MAGN|nr:hypothetical protein GIB67_003715 [Kingdonia uniflora]
MSCCSSLPLFTTELLLQITGVYQTRTEFLLLLIALPIQLFLLLNLHVILVLIHCCLPEFNQAAFCCSCYTTAVLLLPVYFSTAAAYKSVATAASFTFSTAAACNSVAVVACLCVAVVTKIHRAAYHSCAVCSTVLGKRITGRMGMACEIFKCSPCQCIHCTTLDAFLKMAGFTLFRKYKSQFLKILNIISRKYVLATEARRNPELNKVFISIQLYIDKRLFFQEPTGWRLETSLSSSQFYKIEERMRRKKKKKKLRNLSTHNNQVILSFVQRGFYSLANSLRRPDRLNSE